MTILDINGRPFADGLYNLTNGLANTRNAMTTNVYRTQVMDYAEMTALHKSGIGGKIVRLKSGYALNNTLMFQTQADEELYNSKLAALIKRVCKWMLVYGRGIVVLHHVGDDMVRPLGNVNLESLKISVFSGDMVSVSAADFDIQSDRYMKPDYYIVRGTNIHHSRVIDFTYVEPTELELPSYRYGGISEFEMIRDQLIADGIVSRASSHMLEKSGSLFYKVDGFKNALKNKQSSALIEYFTQMEQLRSIYGAGILDSNDSVENVSQALQNLAESDQISLRRIAMVTGIALAVLIGESPKGLNATGDNELQTTWDTIRNLQSDYLIKPITECCKLIGINSVEFKESQGQSPLDIAKYEQIIIDNAVKLAQIGEDHEAYLSDKGIVAENNFDDFFKAKDDSDTKMLISELENMVVSNGPSQDTE